MKRQHSFYPLTVTYLKNMCFLLFYYFVLLIAEYLCKLSVCISAYATTLSPGWCEGVRLTRSWSCLDGRGRIVMLDVASRTTWERRNLQAARDHAGLLSAQQTPGGDRRHCRTSLSVAKIPFHVLDFVFLSRALMCSRPMSLNLNLSTFFII